MLRGDVTRRSMALCAGAILLISAMAIAAPPALPETAPGPHIGMDAKSQRSAPSFTRGQPIIGTSYFYWYAVETKEHLVNHDGSDGLTNHPVDMENLSYLRPSWHKQQLRDVMDAGIDFILPVFWGVPGHYERGTFAWSFLGIPPLVAAHDAILETGAEPPAIGMFYDTSILRHNNYNADGAHYHVDLTTPFGREWFYTPIRDIFSLLPPEKWARVDGRPIVFLYSGSYAAKQDADAIDHARRRFAEDFGIECFIVRMRDWLGEGDAVYQWGGALGLQIDRDVAALGPGYDHSAVLGREPLIVERRDGAFYSEAWDNLLALSPERRPWMIHVETWSEWHEGTDIAESREYGRQYIDLTRKFAAQWYRKAYVPFEGALANATEVRWSADESVGIEPGVNRGDGLWRIEKRAGVESIVPVTDDPLQGRYLYFNISELFAYDIDNLEVDLTVTYLDDGGCERFSVDYDNTDPEKGSISGAFRAGGSQKVGNTGVWKEAVFRLPECRFVNRCNAADLRLGVIGGRHELAVREVTVRKVSAR